MPVIVLAHERREILVKGGTTFTFVDDGIESAIELERIRLIESAGITHLRHR